MNSNQENKQEVKGFNKVIDEGSNVYKKYIKQKPSKKFIEDIKSQSYYQLECVKCKISNRKWLEEGSDPFDYPVKMTELPTGRGIKIFYFCNKCGISWRG